MSFSCTLVNSDLNIGDSVLVQVSATGTLGFESDFKQQSFTASSDGSSPVDVGPINGAGFYSLRIVNGDDSMTMGFLAIPTTSGPTSLHLETQAGSATSDDSVATAVNNFVNSLTIAQIKSAASAVIGPWTVANAAGLGTETVLCGVLVSGVSTFAVACYDQSVDLLREFSLSVLKEAATEMKASGTLSTDDADHVVQMLSIALTITNFSEASDNLELLLAALSTLDEDYVENDVVKVTIKYGIDEGHKIKVLHELLKK